MATCPSCKAYYRTLPDEDQDHPCPRCGWFYEGRPDPLDEEDPVKLAKTLAEGGTPHGMGEEWYVDTIEALAATLNEMAEANRQAATNERRRRNAMCAAARP